MAPRARDGDARLRIAGDNFRPADARRMPLGFGCLYGRRHAERRREHLGIEERRPRFYAMLPTLTEALRAGRPVDAETGSIAADSFAPRRVGALMFPIARAHVDHVVLVTDAAIRPAQEALSGQGRGRARRGGRARRPALGGLRAHA